MPGHRRDPPVQFPGIEKTSWQSAACIVPTSGSGLLVLRPPARIYRVLTDASFVFRFLAQFSEFLNSCSLFPQKSGNKLPPKKAFSKTVPAKIRERNLLPKKTQLLPTFAATIRESRTRLRSDATRLFARACSGAVRAGPDAETLTHTATTTTCSLRSSSSLPLSSLVHALLAHLGSARPRSASLPTSDSHASIRNASETNRSRRHSTPPTKLTRLPPPNSLPPPQSLRLGSALHASLRPPPAFRLSRQIQHTPVSQVLYSNLPSCTHARALAFLAHSLIRTAGDYYPRLVAS
ncbi:hypothetical protein DFH07DRAFT_1007567 [Mycena maculata]|uniref:Uncharacterized protein n=1 Tax=Mycena maculata TaxID=230809 RepID=A0AAD7MKF3_9AGAR|nr:hypothetical protein DFH07DRAFT_1007567 [Mycena maculata]